MDGCDPKDSQSVARTLSQMKSAYQSVDWIPEAFRDLSTGTRRHLPKRKLHLRLLSAKRGFFGHGDFREHFFGDISPMLMVMTALADCARYSAFWLSRKHRRVNASRENPRHPLGRPWRTRWTVLVHDMLASQARDGRNL